MGLLSYNDKGLVIGPCIVAKNEMQDGYATTLVGPGWYEMKMRRFGEPDPDLLIDYGWISRQEVEEAAMKAEVGILWF